MSFLGTAILAFWADVDPSGEADYVDWHNREHMPERCAVPGFLRGRRYVAMAPPMPPPSDAVVRHAVRLELRNRARHF